MKQFFGFLAAFAMLASTCHARPPKLVLLVVLDQVPYDYIDRFRPYFSTGGFNYLTDRGANFTDAEYPFAYTKTACGHASIATGTASDRNGMVGNAWYDRATKKRVNCVDDTTEQTTGGRGPGKSPRMLLTKSFSDILREKSGNRSRVIGISNKDRSAILMTGHDGTAYWVDDSLFVSSTYYMKQLPSWVEAFNRSGRFQKYYGRVWTELKPAVAETICDEDDVPYEDNPAHMGRAFPHRIVGTDTAAISRSYYEALDTSPFSEELLLDFAREAFEHESLGVRGVTDILCVGISATDIIGHAYGPNSHEVFDNMLRTDAMLADFFSYIDRRIGLANTLVILSADHGIPPIPEYKKKISPEVNVARISSSEISARANKFLTAAFGTTSKPWVAQTVDGNIYLREEPARERGVDLKSLRRALKDSLTGSFPVDKAYTAEDLAAPTNEGCFCENMRLSFYQSRSGDVMVIVSPFSIIDGATTGTNHGMPYTYDTHVPLMLAGPGIVHGEFNGMVSLLDVAPTVTALLGLAMPPECEGKILSQALEDNRGDK